MSTPAHERARQDRAGEGSKPWRLYDVTVKGCGTEVITAPSRVKALASAWRSDAFSHIDYGDFLKIASAKRRTAPLEDDGYGYVRRRYDVDPQVGQRVTYVGGGSSDGQSGTILYPGKITAHVYVLFDGRERPSNVHPTDLVYGEAPALTAGEDGGRPTSLITSKEHQP